MEDKKIINRVDVSQCEFYIYYSGDRYPHRCGIHKDMFGMPACCDVADCCKNCYFKQLQKEKFENLNNRQMVESAENLIYENSELYKNIKEKEQECEELRVAYNKAQDIIGRVNGANELKSYSLQESIKECDRYRKALEEIEGIVTKYYYDDNWADITIKIDSILDIINKTKDDNNDR